MMRPTKLEILNFRGWSTRVEIDLDRPVTLIVGGNQRGKSSTLNAIEWCLFGPEIEKKSSGIDERGEWEAANRDAPDQPVEVALTLTSDDGDSRLVRRRDPSQRSDSFSLESPEGGALEGADLDEWLRNSSMPDWATWRRAFCQHQEDARGRVLDKADRSAVLGALLGLDEDLRLRSALEARGELAGLEKTMNEIEQALLAEIERPRREVDELKDRIAHKGAPRDSITPTLAAEVARELLDEATAMASMLDIEGPAADVDAAGLDAVASWAVEWPRVARSKDETRSRLSKLRDESRRLAALLAKVDPLEDERRLAAAALAEETSAGGDAAARNAALDRARETSDRIAQQLSAASARRALLKDALAVLTDTSGDACPVCGNPDEDLAARLEHEISTLETAEIASLERAQQETLQAVTSAAAAVAALDSAAKRLERAAARLSEALPGLRSALGIDPGEDIDPLARARVAIESFDTDVASLEDNLSKRDERLSRFSQRADLLRDLVRLNEAVERVEARVDVTALPSWADLQSAIDDSAALAADRDAIAALVRDAQAERSEQRAGDANEVLAAYAEPITGWSGLKIEVSATPKRVAYEIVDDTNRRALPVLNQAAMNALSIALLLAQAEQQARDGRPAWVILDDPIQSLDAEHQRGLATALDRIARHCPVLVGVTPSDLVDRAARYISQRRRIVWLRPGSRAVPIAIDRVEEL